MKLDGTQLRARRLQLALTTRGLAREAQVSQTLIKRLEDTGDPASITCATLQLVLDALSLDLAEALDRGITHASPVTVGVESIGAILLDQTRGITSVALAHVAGSSTATVNRQVEVLERLLRQVGMRLHRGSTGIRLMPAHTALAAADGAQILDAPTNTDLRLVHRTVAGNLHVRDVATMKNGNVSLHRLTNSGLVETRSDGSIVPGPVARTALLLDG